jgi:hypothetical protein
VSSVTKAGFPPGTTPLQASRVGNALARGGWIVAPGHNEVTRLTTSDDNDDTGNITLLPFEAVSATISAQALQLLLTASFLETAGKEQAHASVGGLAEQVQPCEEHQSGQRAPGKVPFRLLVKASPIALGDGVFANGWIRPGTVVAFFPGLCYPATPEHLASDHMPVPAWSVKSALPLCWCLFALA